MIAHTPATCPLMASAYCSYCATYGHFTEGCPCPPAREAVEPIYIEQLISPALAAQYNIRTCTPIPGSAYNTGITVAVGAVIEIPDKNTDLRAFLRCRDIQPSGKIKDNYKKIEMWAAAEGKKIKYIQP